MLSKVILLSIIYTLAVLITAYFCRCLPSSKVPRQIKDNTKFYVELLIIFVSLVLNLNLSIIAPIGDSGAFDDIIGTLATKPFLGFYSGGGINYPPLFNYIFFIVGKAMQLFGIPFASGNRYFIFGMKVPGMLCEFLIAFLLYKYVKKRNQDNFTIPVLLFTLLNPGYIFVTSYISQVDAVYSAAMALTLYFIAEDKLKLSYFAFASAVMLKFQAIFITPVILLATVKKVFLKDFNWKKFWTHLGAGVGSIIYMGLLYVPFIFDFSTFSILTKGNASDNFTSSIQSFGWTSQNTFNFWSLMGYNFVQEREYFGPFSCTTWGYTFIVLLVILTCILFIIRRKDTSMDVMPLLAAVLVSGMICFSIRMMPRYLYPAIWLLILGWIIRPNIKRFICALAFSIAFFFEVMFDYMIYQRWVFNNDLIAPKILAIYMLLCFGFLIYTILTEKKDKIYK